MTTLDLARIATAATDPRDDRRHVSALVWLIPQAAFWGLVWAALT